MSNRPKLQRETSTGSSLKTRETGKSGFNAPGEMNEQKLKNRLDETEEMFRGLITGDEHYHSRGSSSAGLW